MSQVSRRAPEPQLLQAGMNNGQAGQVKLFQPDTMQSPQVRQLRVGAVFPDKLEGQTAAIFGGMDGTGVRPLVLEQELLRSSPSHSS